MSMLPTEDILALTLSSNRIMAFYIKMNAKLRKISLATICTTLFNFICSAIFFYIPWDIQDQYKGMVSLNQMTPLLVIFMSSMIDVEIL
jgi:hypothetical protein